MPLATADADAGRILIGGQWLVVVRSTLILSQDDVMKVTTTLRTTHNILNYNEIHAIRYRSYCNHINYS